jgi:hypothetical protein
MREADLIQVRTLPHAEENYDFMRHRIQYVTERLSQEKVKAAKYSKGESVFME